MAKVPELLLKTLDSLGTEELNRLQWYLINGVGEFRPIPLARLDNADRPHTVNVMVQSYEHREAVEIALTILKKMDQNQLAEELKTNYCQMEQQCEDGAVKNPADQQHVRQLMPKLKQLCERIMVGNSQRGRKQHLNDIYTDLIIVEGKTGGAINQHEVMQLQMSSVRPADSETHVKCNNIFKVTHAGHRNRTVLTLGVAGVGKTVSVRKFILDWATGKQNQDINFIFPLSFRELNLKKDKKLSLIEMLNQFFQLKPELKSLPEDDGKVLFIFDGLDECRFPLCFEDGKEVKDVNEKTTVGSLITNLITRNLLPFALIWITCRPAAAFQIPQEYIHLVTEVQGFNDEQKKDFFSKYCKDDEDMAVKIVSHIKKSRTLYIMCQIPVFCWISAIVLKPLMETKDSETEIPTTLTGIYINFLLLQKKQMRSKYCQGTTIDHTILKLGKLAFRNLNTGDLMFYEDDLKKCGIKVTDGAVYSGVCTQIFNQQEGVSERNIFSFVHLSVQECLSALYVHHLHCNKKRNAFKQKSFLNLEWWNKKLTDLHRDGVQRSLESENGHLDLFLRFLLGFSVKSNHGILKDLVSNLKISEESVQDTICYIKHELENNMPTGRSLNLLHCLSELQDNSLTNEIQNYLNSGNLSTQKLSSTQWSALVFVLLMSEKTQDKFELKKYMPSDEGLRRLLPVVKATTRAILAKCNLGEMSCGNLGSVLQSANSPLRELDLSNNDLQDLGVKLLFDGLQNSHCKLETLRLAGCNLTTNSCEILMSVLQSANCSLRELDLSNNDLQDSGVKLLSDGLKSSHCKLKTLRLTHCNLGVRSCANLGSVLQSANCSLKELELSNNDLQNSGVKLLSDGLKSSHCKLETLSLSHCMISEEGCSSLASALSSNPSHLKELDLTYNHPGDSGAKPLSARLENPHCRLETLRLEYAGSIRLKAGVRKYFCALTLNPNTAHRILCLSEKNRVVNWSVTEQHYPDHPERFDCRAQVLCEESVRGRRYWEVEMSSGGIVDITVSYKEINRKGRGEDCVFGFNNQSWSLFCSSTLSFYHNNIKTKISKSPSSRIGVYVDHGAGTLSFYRVSDTMTLLHRVHTTFTQPLYAGFGFYGNGSAVRLCDPK